MSVVRFGVSLEKDLLDALDEYSGENMFPNRSQALRYLISHCLAEKKWRCSNPVAGSVTLMYEHHRRDLVQKLTALQHEFHEVILSSQHFHLDGDRCMEIIAVNGTAARLTELADRLHSVKGLDFVRLTITGTGKNPPA